VAERTYVPGYGFVISGSSGTSGSNSRYASGRIPAPVDDGSQRGAAADAAGETTADPVVSYTLPKVTTGVAFPLSGYGGFGELGGYAYGQRLGNNPDAREAFPYGVVFRTEKDATASFYELTPEYQRWLDNLAENPLIGTSASSGRMLWERITGLSAERTSMGRPASPQQIAAEIANNVGLSPLEGRTEDIDWSGSSSSGSYSGGGGGYGGGGGGGGSVSLTNPTSARGLLMQTMQSVLGRNPTNSEYKTFLKALNEAEMSNPQTVGFQDGMAVGSGGVDPGVVALDYVEGLEEFKSAAGQRTLDAFMQVLGA